MMSLLHFWALKGAVTLLPMCGFIKNILICVPKMNDDLTGLGRHEGKYLMTEMLFLGELTL